MRKTLPLGLLFGLVALYVLHNDIWFWSDARLVFGIPIGLFYHIVFCVAASLMMTALVKFAWPSHLETEEEGDGSS